MARSAKSTGSSSAREFAELLAAKEMVVVCGSGGTGKTTVAAALGAQAAATLGGRVLVLTVDPARRLAAALGLDGTTIGNTPVQVAMPADCRGELWMAMLDTKAGWDELIRRHAPDAALRDTVLANPLYRNNCTRPICHNGLCRGQPLKYHKVLTPPRIWFGTFRPEVLLIR